MYGKNKEKLFSQRVEFKTILKGVEQFFIWFILVVVETITILQQKNGRIIFYYFINSVYNYRLFNLLQYTK